MNRTIPRTAVLASTALLTLSACGAAAVEDSTEYLDLADELDSITAELEETRTDLDELDDQLAIAESRLADANTEVAAGEDLIDDLAEFLTLDLINSGGLSRTQAECVTEGFADDAEMRASYLLLLDQASGADDATNDAALEDVTDVLSDCGVELPEAQEPVETAGPPIEELLGDIAVTGGALPTFAQGADQAVGMVAPVLVGADYDGNPTRVDAVNDGPTMVIFLAHWCPHCNAEVPKLMQLRDEGRIPDGVNVVAVSTGLNPDAPNYPPDQWLADWGWSFPVIADGVPPNQQYFLAGNAYGLTGVPFTVLVDGDGIVVGRWAGERTVEEIEGALIRLAG